MLKRSIRPLGNDFSFYIARCEMVMLLARLWVRFPVRSVWVDGYLQLNLSDRG
jgi:hypothetical protein